MSGDELRRWYWLRDELADFARRLELPTSGSKDELTALLVAHLDGEPAPPRPSRRMAGAQLSGPLDQDTAIPPGQRSSQALRAWFEEQIGPAFRFDGEMREFIATSAGERTLGDAVAHWYASRSTAGNRPIDPQFEFNRFTRRWHATNPGGGRPELLAAWDEYRRRPVEERGRV